MFSIAEIIDIAIQLEMNGEKAYRKALDESEDGELNNLLTWMAEEELQHAERFSQLKEKIEDDEDSHLMKEMSDTLINDFIKGQTFSLEDVNFSVIGGAKDLIEIFIEFEKDTILFYDMLKSFILDEKTIEQLEHIISEEESHVVKLKELLLRNS